MFLSVTKVNDGYQFRNGPRRMPLDEVMRRCPIEWVRTFNPDVASWLESKASKEVK